MRVRVLFFGILKQITGRSEEMLDVEPGATLGSVFEAYAAQFETLRDKRPSILFARNQEFSSSATPVSDNDEIAFLPPVSGGSPSHTEDAMGHIYAITRDPIDSRELALALQQPSDGAVVVFEGIVRNNTKGRTTQYLDYECYEGMALARMMQIGQETAARFAVGRIGIVHRLGRLQIGEASVAIVATAPHRQAAFDASRELIDRLKREVPIWKKEFFEDGAVWVDGEWDEGLRAAVDPVAGR